MTELTIPLERKSKEPLYEQIYNFIKREIRSGSFPASTRLPSTRALALHLEVSRSTAQIAYEQLLSEGYIEVVPCKGYYVSGIETLIEVPKILEKKQQSPVLAQSSLAVDFSPGGIDWKHFPYSIWRKLSRNILSDEHKDLFAAGDSQGEFRLRSAIASYLHYARGVYCTPEQIVVGAGNEYLLMLLSQLIDDNRIIAMENPTYRQAYRVFRSLNQEVVSVEMDKNGMNVKLLEETKASIAYVMPSHQFPFGIVMPVKRRQELLAWAQSGEGRYIIEDDYDSEFRYKGIPVPALQGTDHHQRVIYMGTFSKSIAPAIRISYMVLPAKLMEVYNNKISFYASTVSRVDQMILAKFIGEGYYERHLNKMRGIYKSKHDCLLNALKALEDRFEISGDYAGTHILLKSNNGSREEELIKKAGEKSVGVYGLSSYYIGEYPENYEGTILLGYADLSEEEIEAGISLLKEAWC